MLLAWMQVGDGQEAIIHTPPFVIPGRWGFLSAPPPTPTGLIDHSSVAERRAGNSERRAKRVMKFSNAVTATRSRSEVIEVAGGLMLFRIEEVGARGEISAVEYHVSRVNLQERWIFNNQFDATSCFYETLETGAYEARDNDRPRQLRAS